MIKHTQGPDNNQNRVIVIVLDGAGAGELPDAAQYGDSGSSTLYNVIKKHEPLKLDNLASLGLGNIINIDLDSGHPVLRNARFGRMAPLSPGKDTTSGHWELAGLVLEDAFPLFPHGFPDEVINSFEEAIGRGSLGNFAASGTEIIEQLGKEHLDTGYPIVYTSADSVFQIAAHEDIIPRELLYDWCIKARVILRGEFAVGRVIARPFTGKPGSFTRTAGRHDYSLEPPGKTLLDCVNGAGLNVAVIGKVKDIFAGRGVKEHLPGGDNKEIAESLLDSIKTGNNGLLWATFIDFDMIYGHRNDSEGFARALEDFDSCLEEILKNMNNRDLLFVTADHGCDPTFHTTDHTREYVPIMAWNNHFKEPVNLGTRTSYADMAASAAEWLKIPLNTTGVSFISD
jgi:phosphopentomutase